MHLVTSPDSSPLLTLADLREGEPVPINGWTPEEDARDNSIIEKVSGMFADHLGRHLEAVERTEGYYIRAGRKKFRLMGYPLRVDDLTGVAVSHAQTWNLAKANNPAVFGDDRFSVDPISGMVTMVTPYTTDSYAIVTYTGGLVHKDDAGESVTPLWLREAATRQASYLKTRLNKLGGSVETVAGAGATFEQQYGLLDFVREILDANRKAA